MRELQHCEAALIVGQPIATLRVVPVRLLGIDRAGLPLDHEFSAGDVMLSLAGAAFAPAAANPVAVQGGAAGTFNIQLTTDEIATRGVLRIQVVSDSIFEFEDVSQITTVTPPAPLPLAALRVYPIRLLALDGTDLPLDHVFSVEDVKISLAGAAFSNSINLPVAVSGGEAGTFNLQLEASELAVVGALRIQVQSATVQLYEDISIVDVPFSVAVVSVWTPSMGSGGATWTPV